MSAAVARQVIPEPEQEATVTALHPLYALSEALYRRPPTSAEAAEVAWLWTFILDRGMTVAAGVSSNGRDLVARVLATAMALKRNANAPTVREISDAGNTIDRLRDLGFDLHPV